MSEKQELTATQKRTLSEGEAFAMLRNSPAGEAFHGYLLAYIDSAVNRVMEAKSEWEARFIAGQLNAARTLLQTIYNTINAGREIRRKQQEYRDLQRQAESERLQQREHRMGVHAIGGRSDAIG